MVLNNISTVKVWDLPVRIFHWSLAIAFVVAWLTEDDLARVHEFAGYTILALVVFRIMWGFVGTKHARFSDFVSGPGAVFKHLSKALQHCAPRHLGHNPAGGAMAIALLATLLVTAISGWLLSENGLAISWLEDLHEFFANVCIVLITLHVAGVIWSSIADKENLVTAMFTGRKRT